MKYPYMLTRTAKKQKKSIASITINSEILASVSLNLERTQRCFSFQLIFNIALEMAGNTTWKEKKKEEINIRIADVCTWFTFENDATLFLENPAQQISYQKQSEKRSG